MKFLRRVQPILAIGVSVLVILICVAIVIGIWVLQGKITSVAVTMLTGVDKSAQVMRNGVLRVDTGLVNLGDSVSIVEKASEQLAQNISDKGLLLLLLPPAQEQELTTAVQSVQQDFTAIQELLDATGEMLQTLDSIPFIETSGKSLAAVEALQNGMNEITAQVEQLKTGIAEFRSGVTENILRITNVTTSLNHQLDGLRSDLALVDTELNNVQVQARKLQRLFPTLLLLNSLFVTLIAGWIVYSQVVMIDRSTKHYREIRNRAAIVSADETEGSLIGDEKPVASEITESTDPDQKEAYQNFTGEAEQGDDSSPRDTA